VGITGITARVLTCLHRVGAFAFYVENDPTRPPVICLSGIRDYTMVTLTNQTIYADCPACHDEVTKFGRQKCLPQPM
jgi:hypothetical protein